MNEPTSPPPPLLAGGPAERRSPAYRIVADFERAMADFCGAPHAVAVESCSAALFLSAVYCHVAATAEVHVPSRTYPSVPAAIIHAGGRVRFEDVDWQATGWYGLAPTPIIDSAKYLARGMYPAFPHASPLVCLSFHAHKTLGVGRGGMVLCADPEAAAWLRLARFSGRHEAPLAEDRLTMIGWDMYLTPEQAARGLELMQWLPERRICEPEPYQDLSRYEMYRRANREP
ncbi:MAG: DegT/DnrJ/EryC1/StrS family aminotransferase [Thermoanaerobaculia bacterium]|nr:DegT/DnrJ/EryC1/StrS family aminotransferase [Thermoanaerobaculia bacterium]